MKTEKITTAFALAQKLDSVGYGVAFAWRNDIDGQLLTADVWPCVHDENAYIDGEGIPRLLHGSANRIINPDEIIGRAGDDAELDIVISNMARLYALRVDELVADEVA